VKTSDFDYYLPPELIATHPAPRRDSSRLLVMDRESGKVRHDHFGALTGELRSGDCLVLNDSRVIPARLIGRRRGGGRAELLLLEPDGDGAWRAMAKPAKKLRPGDRIELIPAGNGAGEEAWATIETAGSEGLRTVRFESRLPAAEILERFGRMPLPPYILSARKHERPTPEEGPEEEDSEAVFDSEDRERYQTVYAEPAGSVAAPTAGLHFTPELLSRLQVAGVEIQRVTLHVGPGTFAPIKAGHIEDHRMHREPYEIGEAAAAAIERARRDPGRRVIAVGTTVTRTLEACVARHGSVVATRETTDLMIVPGHEFRAIDGLVTNFHLPRSTLLMLVAAFTRREAVRAAYAEAVCEGYRFYSYGDAMFIR